MKTTRLMKLFTLAAAMFATVATTSATAHAGEVNRLLTGGVVDPAATTLRVVPPRGGMVMIHQRGRAVAWFTRAGFVNLKPNQVYGMTATRGSSMLFNSNMMMRRGFTEAVWGQSNTPQMSFAPAFNSWGQGWGAPGFGTPGYRGGVLQPRRRGAVRTRTRGPAHMPAATHQQLLGQLDGMSNDSARWRTMSNASKRYKMTVAQKRAVSRTFKSRTYRVRAEQTLGLSKRFNKRPTRATSRTNKSTRARSTKQVRKSRATKGAQSSKTSKTTKSKRKSRRNAKRRYVKRR